MSDRISATFRRLKDQSQSGFIAYITAGDPSLESTLALALALEKAGVDILELGVPFSDPLADGATIQAAAGRALEGGATVKGVLELVRSLRRESELPIVLFTYLNPIYIYGFESFHADAAAAGADGVLILDLPPDEEGRNAELLVTHGLAPIRLIAPTTPVSRMASIAATAQGFIYYVSREGVTGEQTSLSDTISDQVAEIRKYTDLPIAVGFGISTPEQASAVAKQADAVVVGSAIVRCIAENAHADNLVAKVSDFVRPLVQATQNR